MKKDYISCYCGKNNTKFLFSKDFSVLTVDVLYCPQCSELAPNKSLLINVKVAYELKIGVWAIKFNPTILKEQDRNFKDKENYYLNLWDENKIFFKMLSGRAGEESRWELIGLKGTTPEVKYSFEVEKVITKDRRKKHSPKRIKKLN